MPQYTSFLELTLPSLREFVNSWHTPLNGNFEALDDYLDDMYKALVTTGSSSDWADLKGTAASLSARLAVSINADGTLNVANSPEILGLGTSSIDGAFDTPVDRLNNSDAVRFEARQPFAGGRFTPVPAAGPTAGFPPEGLDSGIAFRAADFGARDSSHPMASPMVPWSPGLVSGGSSPMMTGQGVGKVRITGDSPPAVFNIDGYLFRIREIIDLDWNLLAPTDGDYVWIFVDRNESAYGNANFRYTAPSGGAVATKDLRKLQSGTGTGVTSGSTFSATGAQFDTLAFGKVREGDMLVITAGAAAGSYVVDELDITTPDTKFTIRGTFKADVSGATWYVLDNAHPNIGAVVTDADATTLPPFVAGRVYIGRAVHASGGSPTDIVTFLAGGVYDSGWVDVDAATDFPLTMDHNLGTVPTGVQVWCRLNASASEIYDPMVKRTVVTDTVNPDTAEFFLPSLRVRSSDLDLTITLLNATVTPLAAAALFTDSADANQPVGQIRVIARR